MIPNVVICPERRARYPSRKSVIEAMANGLVVISTAYRAIPEMVLHGETGWLVPPGDGRALPKLVAGYPAMVAAVLNELRASTGIDIPGILGRRLEAAVQGPTGPGGAR